MLIYLLYVIGIAHSLLAAAPESSVAPLVFLHNELGRVVPVKKKSKKNKKKFIRTIETDDYSAVIKNGIRYNQARWNGKEFCYTLQHPFIYPKKRESSPFILYFDPFACCMQMVKEKALEQEIMRKWKSLATKDDLVNYLGQLFKTYNISTKAAYYILEMSESRYIITLSPHNARMFVVYKPTQNLDNITINVHTEGPYDISKAYLALIITGDYLTIDSNTIIEKCIKKMGLPRFPKTTEREERAHTLEQYTKDFRALVLAERLDNSTIDPESIENAINKSPFIRDNKETLLTVDPDAVARLSPEKQAEAGAILNLASNRGLVTIFLAKEEPQ